MKILLLITMFTSCAAGVAPTSTKFSVKEAGNLNTYLSSFSTKEPLDFGTVIIENNQSFKVREVYVYSYKRLKNSDNGKKIAKPNWLLAANKNETNFQEIFEATEEHLHNIKKLIDRSHNLNPSDKLNCCTSDQRRQLLDIGAKLEKILSNVNPDKYSNENEYFLASLYWIFKKD